MGILTIKIDDALEQQLRKRAGELKGAKRGSISETIEEALQLWLKTSPTRPLQQRTYTALKDGQEIAQAQNLSQLATLLRKRGMNPREVIIRSTPPQPPTVRLGFRTKKISR